MSENQDFCPCGCMVACQRRRDAASHLISGDPHEAVCTVRWEPRDGRPVVVTAPYLSREPSDGFVWLCPDCGLGDVTQRLGVVELVAGHDGSIAEVVNAQIEERGWAVLKCREGTAVLWTDGSPPSL